MTERTLKEIFSCWGTSSDQAPTDAELDRLIDATTKGQELAIALGAGAAVELYYVNLWQSACSARRVRQSYKNRRKA